MCRRFTLYGPGLMASADLCWSIPPFFCGRVYSLSPSVARLRAFTLLSRDKVPLPLHVSSAEWPGYFERNGAASSHDPGVFCRLGKHFAPFLAAALVHCRRVSSGRAVSSLRERRARVRLVPSFCASLRGPDFFYHRVLRLSRSSSGGFSCRHPTELSKGKGRRCCCALASVRQLFCLLSSETR